MASGFYGSRGESVKSVQKRLNEMGAALAEDGIWGNKTEAAYKLLMGEGALAGGTATDPTAKSVKDMFARYEYTAPTDDEIAEKARAAVAGEYDAMETSEKQKTERILQALARSIEGLDPKYAARLDSLDNYYASARQDISNQAIKRGMGRSSLYLETLNQSHNDLLAAKEQANTEYQTELNGLNAEIQKAQLELDENLGSISARRESEIRKYMDDLTSKREDTVFQMIKYNNDIAQKEAEYYQKLLDQIAEENAAASTGGSGGGRRSSGRRRSGGSGSSGSSTNAYNSAMNSWYKMSNAQKLQYFNSYGASLRQSNSKAYYAMKTEVDSIKRSGAASYKSAIGGATTNGAKKVYSSGR